MEEAYRQARKRGEQGRRRAISQSEHPYLTDLDSLVAQLPLGQRENVGLRDIPLEMVVGTVTKGRQSAFSCNFMPLLPFSTEFARKWSNLYDIQVTEGYRDPVIVTEAMKMETTITAPMDGIVSEIHVKAGQRIESGDLLMLIE